MNKHKLIKASLFFSICLSLISFAQAQNDSGDCPNYKTLHQQKIKQFSTGPFDPVEFIKNGPLKCTTVKSSRARSTIQLPQIFKDILSKKIKKTHPKININNYELIANFTAQNEENITKKSKDLTTEFWIALVPKTGIKAITIQKTMFDPRETAENLEGEMLAHSQLKFELKNPALLLIAQSQLSALNLPASYQSFTAENWTSISELMPKALYPINSLSWSFEAVYVQEKNAGFNDDYLVFRNAFATASRLTSYNYRLLEIKKQKETNDLDLFLHEYPLNNTHQKNLDLIWANTLRSSTETTYNSKPYHILINSCTTELFKIIDASIEKESIPNKAQQMNYYLKSKLAHNYLGQEVSLVAQKINQNPNANAIVSAYFNLHPKELVQLSSMRKDLWLTENRINQTALTSPMVEALPAFVGHNLFLRKLIKKAPTK